jgi:DNA-damage-inducible protein J
LSWQQNYTIDSRIILHYICNIKEVIMATTVLQVRLDENLKNEAAEIFESLGIDIPTAIRIFFKRAVAEKGIPFELRDPSAIYNANPGWKAFMDLRKQAQRSAAAGMSESEIEAEIAAYRSGK